MSRTISKLKVSFRRLTLRSVLGQYELDELLSEREKLNVDIQVILDQQTDQWGHKSRECRSQVWRFRRKHDPSVAKQAKAERERHAKVINANSEYEAAAEFVEATEHLTSQPTSMQLRYLQTLTEIAGEKSSTIVFPLPVNIMDSIQRLLSETPEQ